MSTEVQPKHKLHEDDIAWGHKYVMTGKMSKCLRCKLGTSLGIYPSVSDGVRVVFAEDINRKWETPETAKTYLSVGAKSALAKVVSAIDKIAQMRARPFTFPFSQGELGTLGISASDTPQSWVLYEQLNKSFAGFGYNDLLQAFQSKARVRSKPTTTANVQASETATASTNSTSLILFKGSDNLALRQIQREGTLTKAAQAAFGAIVGSVPDELLVDMVDLVKGNLEVTSNQFRELALLVDDFRSGRIVAPHAFDFLQPKSTQQKLERAQLTLRSIIATSIIKEGIVQPRTKGLVWRLGRDLNNLSYYISHTNIEEGYEIVKAALSDLSAVERVMIYQTMSTNIKHEMYYPDIEECTEEQMAQYIRRVIYLGWGVGKKSAQIDTMIREDHIYRLSLLAEGLEDRVGTSFNFSAVIDGLCKHHDANFMFGLMIEIARRGDYIDTLQWFFNQHPATARYAQLCSEHLEDDIDMLSVE